ncbi:hypothetical protein ACFWNL_18220 [Kitasatospora sp. NPDC058397]|uniref:hypothetical protein n=1 Tax=unclassified Kitasatospora TaxID=2633591 RepID=UPI003654A7F9
MTKRSAPATRRDPALFDTETVEPGPPPKPAAKPRAKPLKPADLPLHAPLIHGETTASLLARTAAANGIAVDPILKAVHTGRLALPAGGVQPQQHDVRVSAAALERLATLLGRPVDQLQRAAPNLRADRLLDESAAVVRLVPWPAELGGAPLMACPLCQEAGAWLVGDGHRWRPCPCGRRWLGADDGGFLLEASLLPDLGRALVRHRAMDHQLGPAGDALVADAHQVMLWWWVNRQVAHDTWRSREDALGCQRHRRQAAPAVVYPEAMTLADAMARWEQRRRRPDASAAEWLADVAEQFAVPGIARGREREPLRHWLRLHPAGAAPAGGSSAERRWSQLPALHRRSAEPGPWQAVSCLRWTFGQPLTSTLSICPHCQGQALSCLWSAAPDCLEITQVVTTG